MTGQPVHIVVPAAHHDGSELYVPQQVPTFGSTVAVRVRTADPLVTAVHLRTVTDGEPAWVTAVRDRPADRRPGAEQWWTAQLPISAPTTHYRFLLVRSGSDGAAGTAPQWLNASGLWSRDVPDYHDFRLVSHDPGPDWALDAVIYQVFPDRFARAANAPAVADIAPDWANPSDWDEQVLATGPGVAQQFFGGDLDGIREHLDHLVELGVSCLYLTPVFPARSNHRYNASSFDHVDPLLGGDDALVRLVTQAHARGLHVIGDITTNHSGDDHPWFTAALQAAPGSADRGNYYLDDAGGYLAWLGVTSLPKLNFSSEALREEVYGRGDSVIARWLRPPFELDGWRVDVANMTGRRGAEDNTAEVARGIRDTVDAVRPGSVLLAEHGHDYTADLVGDGWQGTMNYAGFTRPVWSWLAGTAQVQSQFLGVPGGIAHRDAGSLAATADDFAGLVPWTVVQRNWNLLDSHDTPRFSEVTGDPTLTTVGIGLLFTMPGVPMVFAGAELGLGGVNGEDSRKPMPWDDKSQWDDRRLTTYRELIALRQQVRALRRGGLRWVLADGDVLAYLRETPDERILVVAARAPWVGADLPAGYGSHAEILYGSTDLTSTAGSLAIPGGTAGVSVWRLS
ncbi:MAG: glycoside hydrolase family 13 protein [Actinomycetota bacterium]|nr:glycoside hydrolase family 13 protein [Actinomycetota bacterium]